MAAPEPVSCPKHTTGGGPCYCQPSSGIALLSDLLDDDPAAGRPSLAQAASIIQEELADLVDKGYWVCFQLAPGPRKSGKAQCLAYVLNPPGKDGGQIEHSKAFGPDLAEALAGAIRGDHPARR